MLCLGGLQWQQLRGKMEQVESKDEKDEEDICHPCWGNQPGRRGAAKKTLLGCRGFGARKVEVVRSKGMGRR